MEQLVKSHFGIIIYNFIRLIISAFSSITEVLHALCFMPMFLLDMEKVGFAKVNDPTTNYMVEVLTPILEEPEMVQRMQNYLKDFFYRGYLD